MSLKFRGAVALVATVALADATQAASYGLSWTGSTGFSMTGSFSFPDTLLGQIITFGDLDDLAISVFEGAALIGSRSLSADGAASPASGVNFNFDSALGVFLTGGYSAHATGQEWFTSTGGTECDSVGFVSGSGGQGVCVIEFVEDSFVSNAQSSLTATRLAEPAVVSLPSALPLLAGGLLGLALLGRRRRG